MTEKWRDDPRENTAPTVVAGDFLAEQGYANPDETRLKFSLANRIALLIEDMQLSQTKVATLTGLAQSDVSRIVNGSVKNYSLYRLMAVLASLGQDVTVAVHRSTEPQGRVVAEYADV